ncbi:hypothetical protein [Streptomyces sp. NPDC003480]
MHRTTHGEAVRAVRYVPLEHLDLRLLPEVVAGQRRWPGVARRAVRAGVEPEQAFMVAHAVVARWWDQAPYWEQQEIWPRRLHQLAGGSVGSRLRGGGSWDGTRRSSRRWWA